MPVSDWIPTTADVAAKIPTRLIDDANNVRDDFDSTSFPTDLQVSRLIEATQRELSSKLPDTIPDDELIESAKDLAALRTAMAVELTYFPRQVGSGESPYPQFKQLFDDNVKALELSIEAKGGGVDEETGLSEGPTMSPAGLFPDPAESIGLHTEW